MPILQSNPAYSSHHANLLRWYFYSPWRACFEWSSALSSASAPSFAKPFYSNRRPWADSTLFSSSSSSAAVIVVARYFFIAMLLISVVVGNVVVVVIPHEIRWRRHPHYNIPLRIAMAIIRDNIVAHSRRHRPDDNDDDTPTLSFCPYRTGR